jgi:hypothetical protein
VLNLQQLPRMVYDSLTDVPLWCFAKGFKKDYAYGLKNLVLHLKQLSGMVYYSFTDVPPWGPFQLHFNSSSSPFYAAQDLTFSNQNCNPYQPAMLSLQLFKYICKYVEQKLCTLYMSTVSFKYALKK